MSELKQLTSRDYMNTQFGTGWFADTWTSVKDSRTFTHVISMTRKIYTDSWDTQTHNPEKSFIENFS